MPPFKKDKMVLVIGHAEHVSRDMLEKPEYLAIIKEFVAGKPGVYALFEDRDLKYVGLAEDLPRRLSTHSKKRPQDEWDNFSLYITANKDSIHELESLILHIALPKKNKKSGAFAASEELDKKFRQRGKEMDEKKWLKLVPSKKDTGVRATREREKTNASEKTQPKKNRRAATDIPKPRRRVVKPAPEPMPEPVPEPTPQPRRVAKPIDTVVCAGSETHFRNIFLNQRRWGSVKMDSEQADQVRFIAIYREEKDRVTHFARIKDHPSPSATPGVFQVWVEEPVDGANVSGGAKAIAGPIFTNLDTLKSATSLDDLLD